MGKMEYVKCKVNIAETSYFMDSYEPEDSYYDEVTNLAVYMGERGDIDSIHDGFAMQSCVLRWKAKTKG